MMKIRIAITALAFLFTTQCTNTQKEPLNKKAIPMVICFDVEDYTSPETVGMDDIPKWLAEIMTEEGVTGTFFVIGEKARMMERRGRSDVIRAMAVHDIGSHTNYGSIHPTVTEILEHAGWAEGMGTMFENESAGFDELENIFGQRPANLARHGGSYGPQLVAALGTMNAGYVYSPVGLPGHNVVWFCNTLNFHGEGDYGFFDDAYYRDDLFDPMLEKLDSLIPASIEDMDMVVFFGCHPSKVRSIQFWDFNYYKGANPGPEEWKTPELRSMESMETAKKNFRRLIRYLDHRDDIELTTFRDLVQRFSSQRDTIGQAELERIAKRVLEEQKVIMDDFYSPAEYFTALTETLIYFKEHGQLPGLVRITRPFGPLEMPPTEPEVERVSADAILQLADEAMHVIRETGHLPASLIYSRAKIGSGSLLALFCDYYIRATSETLPDLFQVVPMESYPSVNEEQIIREVESCKTWPVHREDLNMSQLVEMTRLQLWTLKPARES